MPNESSINCTRCGSPLPQNGSACPKCLLITGFEGESQPEAERIFQVALSYTENERDAFIIKAAAGNPELLADVQMLLAGYAEEGGDDAALTISGAANARAEWVISAEEPGTVIDRYRLVKRVGEGGMGIVWEADQTHPLKRKVALKVIKLGMDTVEVVKRFEQERQILAILSHPNIAQVYDAGSTVKGRPYFVMEYVPGESITDYCRKRELSLQQALELMLEVCSAIEHAHENGIVHRDLKPSNILIVKDKVKVIDFGVAKATTAVGCDHTLLTNEARVLGTLAYMSPEQAIGSPESAITPASDVYSLGVILYELASGRLPVAPERLESSTFVERQRILVEEEPNPPSVAIRTQIRTRPETGPESAAPKIASGFRKDFDRVVMKALEKEPERRYTDAAALGEDLRRFIDGVPVNAGKPSTLYRWNRKLRRQSPVVLVAAAFMVMLALVFAGWLISRIPDPIRTLVVTSVEDSGVGSLRETIATAASGDRIVFDKSLAGETITLESGHLLINRSLTLDASDLKDGITIDAGGRSRVIVIENDSGQVTLRSLTITGGASSYGAGIECQSPLLLESCHVTGNTAQADGGGIRSFGTELVIRGCSFTENSCSGDGGGLLVYLGSAKVENSTFINNSCADEGGGIYLQRCTSELTHCTFVGNRAVFGGGVAIEEAVATTLTNNLATDNSAPNGPDVISILSKIETRGTNLLSDRSGSNFKEGLLEAKPNHGQPTRQGLTIIIPLLPGSPAIDVGAQTEIETDQRGIKRDAKPDLGAFEVSS